jgi:predicted PurR-regulated permease PerM
MAGLLNFVPYLGTAVGVIIVGMVSFLTFEQDGQAILPPLAYLLLSSIEGGLVTPTLLGRRLLLSPIVVIIWLSLWTWLWGVLGGLVAVPMLVVLKVVLMHIPNAENIAALLGVRRGSSAMDGMGELPSSPTA